MQRLIKEGASVYQPDGRGMNALMHAVLNDHAPMVHWLLKERGAQISDIKRD
jgi:ankyrin repeat protein